MATQSAGKAADTGGGKGAIQDGGLIYHGAAASSKKPFFGPVANADVFWEALSTLEELSHLRTRPLAADLFKKMD
uniref:Uncharacterized protein n=1 Tax=Parascaris univalens TaxID=6257 RepID=A0A915BUN9_PARUN